MLEEASYVKKNKSPYMNWINWMKFEYSFCISQSCGCIFKKYWLTCIFNAFCLPSDMWNSLQPTDLVLFFFCLVLLAGFIIVTVIIPIL